MEPSSYAAAAASALNATSLSLSHAPSLSPGPAPISLPAVFAAAGLVLADAVVSWSLGLGVHMQLLVGVLRCIAQLTVLGYMLVPIFTYKQPVLVAAYALFMLCVGSHESASRPAFTYPGMTIHVLGCLGVAAFTYLAYALAAAVRPSPWWNPQYSIPTLGLMLGNAVTGVAVGLGTLLDELGRGSGGDGVELMLCLGASRWEASRGAVGRAAKLAMTPILNQLSVVGLVWIPGMMTGQMIAGADPAQAARYQMVVMFIVSATTVSAAAAVVCLAAATLVDAQARLRRDRLSERQRGGGFAAQAWKRVARVWAEWRAGGRRRPVDGREGSPLL